ncbi:MAG: hypothetical protein AB1752_05650 [Candidatus Zixiibacteriota bacterium]
MVLDDHKQVGKTFKPPLTSLGPMSEVSWIESMIPEVLWISLIQNEHGYREGVAVVREVSRRARAISASKTEPIFALTSSFRTLTAPERDELCSQLLTSGTLPLVGKALAALQKHYPECPMNFLFEAQVRKLWPAGCLKVLKNVLGELYDKTTRAAATTQATCHCLAFDADKLVVTPESALLHLNEIQNYPRTEMSGRLAGILRAGMHMFFQPPWYNGSSEWPRYFWNRGLEIDQCELQESPDV